MLWADKQQICSFLEIQNHKASQIQKQTGVQDAKKQFGFKQ
jgi:hypothetical protein